MQKNKGYSKFKISDMISYAYSSGKKSVVFCFALLLPQILVHFQNQGQIWNLLVLTFSKHPLHVQFDQVLAEIFEVKDTRYYSFIFIRIDLRRWKKTEIWTVCFRNCSVQHQRYQYEQEWSLEMPLKGLGCFINCF